MAAAMADRPLVTLAIQLLGPFEVRVNGEPLPRLRVRKGQWLFALLALCPGREVERSWLAGMLWPDSPEELALYNLRRELTSLRHALGSEAYRLGSPASHYLSLELTGAEVDVREFDAALKEGAEGSLEKAVSLYRGPLLDGCIEEWVIPERELREQGYLHALEVLAERAAAEGDARRAADCLRRVVSTDPFRETAHRGLMQALATRGEYAAATRVYRDLRLLLHRDLNADPSPDTTTLFQEIRAKARRRAQTMPQEADVETRGSPPPATPRGRAAPVAGSRRVPDSAPPSRVPASAPSRIPRPLTRLVGREIDARAIKDSLALDRLVTLTGTGGVGKTRLAIQVAEEMADDFGEGAWFVELAPLSDPALVPHAVVSALGMRSAGGRVGPRPVEETLVEFLGDRELLLVLDNCEHLLAACAQIANNLLRGCPRLRILTTSRQSLGLTGEVAWRVPALFVPDLSRMPSGFSQEKDSLSRWMGCDAVRLFVDRARQALPTFKVTPQILHTVAQLCHRLEGLPLAIELAAAHLKAMSVEEIAARLNDRFRLLTGGSTTGLPRQQTLRATMDWSYDLLSDRERVLLRRLSAFAGPFTLEAAEAVCASGASVQCQVFSVKGIALGPSDSTLNTQHSTLPLEEGDVMDLLPALVDKSLVWVEEQEERTHYRLLETTREYAWEKLLEAGEGPSVRGRHLSYFLRLVQEAAPKLSGGEQGAWLDRLERDHHNLHAAIDWSLAAEEGWKEGLPLTQDLFSYWDLRSCFGQALEYLKRFAARSADWPLDARLSVLYQAGFVAMKQANYPAAHQYFEERRTLRRERGELHEDPDQLQVLGALALHEGDYTQAAALLHQSLRIYRDSEAAGREFDRCSMAWTVDILGLVAYSEGEFQSARSFYEQSLTLFREMVNQTGIASALLGLGRIAMRECEYSRARALLYESLSLFSALKEKHSSVGALNSLAWIGCHEEKFVTARTHLVEGLALCRETGRYWEAIDTLVSAGNLDQRQGNSARAVRLFAAAAALRAAIGEAMPPVDRAEYEDSVTAARVALGGEAFTAAWAEGRQMTLEQAVAYALEESAGH